MPPKTRAKGFGTVKKMKALIAEANSYTDLSELGSAPAPSEKKRASARSESLDHEEGEAKRNPPSQQTKQRLVPDTPQKQTTDPSPEDLELRGALIDGSIVAQRVFDNEAAVNRGEMVKPSTKEEVNELHMFKGLLQYACRSGHSPTRTPGFQPSMVCCVEWYERKMEAWVEDIGFDEMKLESLDVEKVKQALRMEI
ncbi:hypothetical protein MBLNU457_g2941t1 [Dothideomycetes sp. NU457]